MTTARQICTRALNELVFFAEGESPSAGSIATALEQLNGLISSWHNQGLLVYYPPATVWKGEWVAGRVFAANDSVFRNGNTYTCLVDHTSSDDDAPGQSPNTATYWTLYAETDMTLDSVLFFAKSHERGIIAMLAVEMAPSFAVQASTATMRKAADGWQSLCSQYFIVPLAASDPSITRMPSQIWPYTIPSVAN